MNALSLKKLYFYIDGSKYGQSFSVLSTLKTLKNN